MTDVWLRAALWLGLALAATLISIRLRIATALSEIVVGTVAQLLGRDDDCTHERCPVLVVRSR